MAYDAPKVRMSTYGKGAYSNVPALNANLTKIAYIKLISGFDSVGIADFDPDNLTITANIYTTQLDFTTLRWHYSNPNLIVGSAPVGYIYDDSIVIRDITGAVPDTIYTLGGAFPANSYIFQYSTNRDHTVFAFTVREDNGTTYPKTGYGFIRSNGTQGYYAFSNLDEVEISRDGTYILIKDSLNKVYVRNIVANTIYTLNPGAEKYPGHSCNGTDYLIGYDTTTNGIYRWKFSDGSVSSVIQSFGADYTQGFHFSMMPSSDSECIVSSYKSPANPTIAGAYDNAIWKLSLDGTKLEITRHLSTGFDGYWDFPRASVSEAYGQSRSFVLFTSNRGVADARAIEITPATGVEAVSTISRRIWSLPPPISGVPFVDRKAIAVGVYSTVPPASAPPASLIPYLKWHLRDKV